MRKGIDAIIGEKIIQCIFKWFFVTAYPTDCVFDEFNVIDRYKTDFENTVSGQEGMWLKESEPTDAGWDAYVKKLKGSCGMDDLLKVYQDTHERYIEVKNQI